MGIRVKYMEFCGVAECEAWLETLRDLNSDTVTIKTPTDLDFESKYPFVDRTPMEYTADVFQQALDNLTAPS